MRQRANVRLADDDGSAFAAFANAFKKDNPKKGAGAPTADASLPVRRGGAQRDGSLGDLRAAAQLAKTLKDPRNWEAEEIGLLGVFASFAAATAFFYFTYVDPPAEKAKPVGPAQQALNRALGECNDDFACRDKVMLEKEPAVITERQLDDCMDKAFSGVERNICKQKFDGGFSVWDFLF